MFDVMVRERQTPAVRKLKAENIYIVEWLTQNTGATLASIKEDIGKGLTEVQIFVKHHREKMYENMPPEDAAEVLENMADSTVAQVLLQVRARQAARIMESMDKIKAAEVSRLLSGGKVSRLTPAPEPTELPEPVEAG